MATAVYGALVSSHADMVGHVAYSLYKRDKLTFCESYRSEYGRDPTDAEMAAFLAAASIGPRVDAYRAEALRALQHFCDEVLAFQLEEERKELQLKLVSELKQARSWPRAVTENLVANLLALALTLMLVILVYGSRIGMPQLLGEAAGYRVEPLAPPASSPAR